MGYNIFFVDMHYQRYCCALCFSALSRLWSGSWYAEETIHTATAIMLTAAIIKDGNNEDNNESSADRHDYTSCAAHCSVSMSMSTVFMLNSMSLTIRSI